MTEQLNPAWDYVNRPKLVNNDRKPDPRSIVVECHTFELLGLKRLDEVKEEIRKAFEIPADVLRREQERMEFYDRVKRERINAAREARDCRCNARKEGRQGEEPG